MKKNNKELKSGVNRIKEIEKEMKLKKIITDKPPKNMVIAIPIQHKVVCWNCKSQDKQLFRMRNEQGKKIDLYTCIDCKLVKPPVLNVSSYEPIAFRHQVIKAGDQIGNKS